MRLPIGFALAFVLLCTGCPSPHNTGGDGGGDSDVTRSTDAMNAVDVPASDTPGSDSGPRDVPGSDSGPLDVPMTPFDGSVPPVRCTAPALADVSHPTTTVGTGTPASCTAAILQAA